jgi:hypothetical protein
MLRELGPSAGDDRLSNTSAYDGGIHELEFIRYQSPTPNTQGRHTGIFGLTNGLLRAGDLSPEDSEWVRRSNDWYDAAYPDPGLIDPTVFDKAIHPYATCWFELSATDLVAAAAGYLDLLTRYGIAWVELRSAAPGRVIYEDDHQVVVVPSG